MADDDTAHRPVPPESPDSHAELPTDPDIDSTATDSVAFGSSGGESAGGDSRAADTGGVRHAAPPRPSYRRPGALAWVFLGGFAGTGARYALEELWRPPSTQWPVATFAVNLVGAFVLGLLLEALARSGEDGGWRRRARLLGGTGFCGAFTTYSSVALESSLLVQHGGTSTAIGYALGTIVAGLVCAWLGIVVGAAVLRRRGEPS